MIPATIACLFKTFNLFEVKGIGSSAGIDSYYKTIGYAGLLIDQIGNKNRFPLVEFLRSRHAVLYVQALPGRQGAEGNLP